MFLSQDGNSILNGVFFVDDHYLQIYNVKVVLESFKYFGSFLYKKYFSPFLACYIENINIYIFIKMIYQCLSNIDLREKYVFNYNVGGNSCVMGCNLEHFSLDNNNMTLKKEC